MDDIAERLLFWAEVGATADDKILRAELEKAAGEIKRLRARLKDAELECRRRRDAIVSWDGLVGLNLPITAAENLRDALRSMEPG